MNEVSLSVRAVIATAVLLVGCTSVGTTNAPGDSPAISPPKPGLRFIAVTMRFENGSSKEVSYTPFYFKLADASGVRRDSEFLTERSDELGSGRVSPGANVMGSIVFSAPVGDMKLQVIYEQFGYKQTTFDLF